MIPMSTTTVSSKGQVVLPKRLRDELEIREGDELEIVSEAGRIVLVPRRTARRRPGWRGWRGAVAGSRALDDHLREHADEVTGERLP
jgi:AbrB family looped-hinge helix DNA binding protein